MISTSIVLLIINIIRKNVISKLLSGKLQIDEKFLKLLIIKIVLDIEEQNYEHENNNLQFYSKYNEEKLIKNRSYTFSQTLDESEN